MRWKSPSTGWLYAIAIAAVVLSCWGLLQTSRQQSSIIADVIPSDLAPKAPSR